MKILVLDNYDSFTYNLVQLIQSSTDAPVDVYRNDAISLEEVGGYDKIILSPGPGVPAEAGILCDLIRMYSSTKSIFGVCLGMQAIGEVFGGKLKNVEEPMHGIASRITHFNTPLFKNIPTEFTVGRYHSWVVQADALPSEINVTATDEYGYIMALEHSTFDVRGVQFHPESILTDYGNVLITNFLNDV